MITEIKHAHPSIKYVLCLTFRSGSRITLHHDCNTKQTKLSASVNPMPTVEEAFQAVMVADEWKDGVLLYPNSYDLVPSPSNDK